MRGNGRVPLTHRLVPPFAGKTHNGNGRTWLGNPTLTDPLTKDTQADGCLVCRVRGERGKESEKGSPGG